MRTRPVGDLLLQLRLRRGLPRTAVARSIGISEVSLWKIERGRNHPSVDVLRRIVRVYEATEADIVELAMLRALGVRTAAEVMAVEPLAGVA